MFIRLAQTFALLGIAASTFACAVESATEPGEPTEGSFEEVVVSEQEVGIVLAFLNDPATDLETLDVRVGLEARAAENLIAHRNGADGVYPSADDDLYGTLAEVDAVPYVGDVALGQIRTWAIDHAPLPAEYVEGVQFTSEQVTAVVWGVNHATVSELDVEVGLSSQAAQNLVAAAPYQSVTSIGAIAYVGPSALSTLKDYAVTWTARMNAGAPASQAGTYDGVTFDEPTAAVALSIAQSASYEQLTSSGMNTTGANAIVNGRPFATLSQVSSTYGVGPATMESLRVYAASGQF